jgi:hypothetical protein
MCGEWLTISPAGSGNVMDGVVSCSDMVAPLISFFV